MIMESKVHLLVCQNFLREVQAVIETERFDEVQLEVLPSCCQSSSGHGRRGLEEFQKLKSDDFPIHSIGCEGLSEASGLAFQPGQPGKSTCFEFLIGRTLSESLMREGAYLLTPGWLLHWRKTIEQWGFDQAMAREYFAESVARLVLLDSGVYADVRKELEQFAAFIDRPFEILPAGLDFLRMLMTNLVLRSRMESQAKSSQAALADANRKLGDFAMVHDLIGRMADMKTESQVIDSIFELFTMFLAPGWLVYVPIVNGQTGTVRLSPASLVEYQARVNRLLDLQQDYAWTEAERGFLVRIGGPDEKVGLLAAGEFGFPQYRQHYLNLAISLSKVCGLAIRNARAYEQLASKIGELQEALTKVKTLSGLLPICAGCKQIRDDGGYWNQIEAYISKYSDATFTHGLCPNCAKIYFPDLPAQGHKPTP